jgi:hypothetical protein
LKVNEEPEMVVMVKPEVVQTTTGAKAVPTALLPMRPPSLKASLM